MDTGMVDFAGWEGGHLCNSLCREKVVFPNRENKVRQGRGWEMGVAQSQGLCE